MATAAPTNQNLLLPQSAGQAARLFPLSLPQARAFPRHPRSGLTLAVHFWLHAALWAGVLILAMSLLYVLEVFVFHLKDLRVRVVANPTEMAVRFFGLAHYTVATYMLFTSKKLHNIRGFLMLGLFSLLAVLACSLFHFFGGDHNIMAVIAVFFFFLMHALRDEVFFYRLRSGKAISDEEYPHVYRMLIWLQVAGLCLLAGVLYSAFIYKLAGDPSQVQFNLWLDMLFPRDWPLGAKMLASAAPFFGVGALAVARIQRQHRGGLFNLLMSHTPLSIIVLATVSIALSSLVIGTAVLNFIILIHFTGWFIFATKSISSQPKAVREAATWRKPNQWVRANLLGFWVFHGGLAALFFGLVAVNHWGFAQRPMTFQGLTLANPLTFLFSEHSLYYWTIAHCTLGFLPKPAAKRR
jgi:hypothetical protein